MNVELCIKVFDRLHIRGGEALNFGLIVGIRGDDIWERRRETARLSVPALCYTLQNNLIFLALSNLSAASCQVLYQPKTITTARFSVVLLGKRFGWRQWLSFFLLAFGVVGIELFRGRLHYQCFDPEAGYGAEAGAICTCGTFSEITAGNGGCDGQGQGLQAACLRARACPSTGGGAPPARG